MSRHDRAAHDDAPKRDAENAEGAAEAAAEAPAATPEPAAAGDEARRVAEERVMLEIIGAIDDLERALEAAGAAHDAESWIEGVRLTVQRLREYLTRQGVTTLDPLGERFDPTVHEAMLEVDAPEGRAAGDVVQVVLKGYARGDRTLRPARVVVARAPAGREA